MEEMPEKLANMSVRYLTVEERLVLYTFLDEKRDDMRDGLNWLDSSEAHKLKDRDDMVAECRLMISAINKFIGGE